MRSLLIASTVALALAGCAPKAGNTTTDLNATAMGDSSSGPGGNMQDGNVAMASAPMTTDDFLNLEQWLRSQRAALARHNPVAGAIDYMLKDWTAFVRFLDDGRICLTNNAAERALRGVALGRKAWLFAGSDRGGERAAFMYTLIGTAKLNDKRHR